MAGWPPRSSPASTSSTRNRASGSPSCKSAVTVDRQKLRAYLAAASLPADGLAKPLQRVVGARPRGCRRARRHAARHPMKTQMPRADAYGTDRTDDLPPYVAIQLAPNR